MQARGSRPATCLQAPMKAESVGVSHGAWAQRDRCLAAWREASKIRRVRLKARERVSLISIALAVLDKPKAGERLMCLRAWVALRLSA